MKKTKEDPDFNVYEPPPPGTVVTPETTVINITDIRPSPANTRQVKDGEIEALAADIKAHGLLHPITVRTNPTDKTKYEIVCGERRWRAIQKLGYLVVPSIIRELLDAEAHEITVSENFQRKDLTPMEEAAGLQALIEDGTALADIAAHLGRPVGWVARRAKLLNLSENWRKTAAGKNQNCRGVLTTGALELVARLDKATQDKVFAEVNLWQGLDVKGMAEALDGFMLTLSSAPWPLNDGTLNGLLCTECEKRTGCQPDLFGNDSGKKAPDKCLDRECWQAKQEAFLAAKVKERREENPGLVLLKTDGGGTRNKGELNKEAISKYSVQEVTKKTPGAREAIQVDGPDAGKTTYIKMDEAAEKKAGEKVGKTMKEKREALEKRRSLALISKAKDYLRNGKSDSPIARDQVINMAAIFGSKQAADWNMETACRGEKEDSMLRRIAEGAMQYAADFLHTLTFSSVINRRKIAVVCDLCGINWEELVEKIEEDIPEPKSWAAEKVPAKAKGKKEKKQTA